MEIKKIIGLHTDKTKQIIVAKYKENVQWLKQFENVPYIVYDKYNKHAEHCLPNIPVFGVRSFEGVFHSKTPTGRESHTYLYHIINNYDRLADINIFLQGNPYEVYGSAVDSLRLHFPRDFDGINFLPLNFPLVICDKKGAPIHRGLPIERIFKRLFQSPCPEYFAYSWGGMFCVSKEYIRKKTLSFYEEMMQIVYEEPLSGYVFERLWATIFACHSFEPYPFYPKYDRSLWQLPGLK